MAFPTTSLLDDFNRASLGAGWTLLFGTLSISSNQLAGQSGGAIGYYNVAQYGADCENYCTLPATPGTGGTTYLYARLKDMNIATVDGYSLTIVFSDSGNETIRLERIDNGAATVLATTTDYGVPDGSRIGLEIIGSTIKGYLDTGSGWSEILSASDGTYSAAGYLGVGIVSSSARMDNFSGGTVVGGGGGISIPVVMHNRQQQGMS